MKPRLQKRGSSQDLVVLVHGLGPSKLIDDVVATTADLYPNADLMVPAFNSSLWSNANPVELARELSDCISQADMAATGYQEIILVGHSLGALLVRKAFVFASGENHELWQSGMKPKPALWAAKVSRIVLLAGMNRGWSVLPKLTHRTWLKTALYWLGDRVARLSGRGRLLLGLKRGAPFVSNLRIQWINLARQGRYVPTTIQILGDVDDVVSAEDNLDLQAGANFIYLRSADAGHLNVVSFAGSAGLRRRDVFERALRTPTRDLPSEYEIPPQQRPKPEVEQVIFIMHGIRDSGHWTDQLAERIRSEASRLGRPDKSVKTITSSYGYFPMGQFLLFAERQKNVRWFMDEYTQALARYPNAASMEFVGHSNGTYLLAAALRRYPACHFNRVVFCGSVVRTDFPWDQMVEEGRILAIRNYVATKDWVVGFFPHFYEYLPNEITIADIGGGGFFGFQNEAAKNIEARFIQGTHGAAICNENFGPISRFALTGTPEPIPEEIRALSQSPFVYSTSRLCWIVWVIALLIIVSFGWLLTSLWPLDRIPFVLLRVIVYVLVVICILNTV